MNVVKLVTVGAAVSALIVGVRANAADLGGYGGYKDAPVAYVPSIWSGYYAGVNGGYAWRQTGNQFGYDACPTCQTPYPAYGGIGAAGGFGGGQIGFSWQGFLGIPQLVAGFETDFQGSGISGKGIDSLGETYKTNLDWFGTVRGRAGFSASNALLYFTGGFAYGGLRQYGEDNALTPTAVYKFDGAATGYVLGGGLEYKFNPAWSFKAEYQYLNFGKHDAQLVSGTGAATAWADGRNVTDDAFHTVRIGLNYWVSLGIRAAEIAFPRAKAASITLSRKGAFAPYPGSRGLSVPGILTSRGGAQRLRVRMDFLSS